MTRIMIALLLVGLILIMVFGIFKIINVVENNNNHDYPNNIHNSPNNDTNNVRIRNIVDPVMRGTATIMFRNMDDPELRAIFDDMMVNGIVDEPRETTHNSNETYEEFVERNQDHNDDSENVHESQVVRELKSRYARLVELNSSIMNLDCGIPPDELRAALREQTYSQIQNLLTEKVLALPESEQDINTRKSQIVLEQIRKKSPIIALAQNIDNPPTDEDLLINCWQRVQSDQNKSNRDNLETAFFDQIIDCAHVGRNILLDRIREVVGFPENNESTISVVCPQGRTARLLQVFTLLDNDPLLARPVMDDAEYRNEAFSKSYAVLQKELAQNPKIEELYNTIDDLTPEQIVEVEKFKNKVKDEIRNTLETDYDGLLKPEKIQTIIKDACMGV